MPETGRTVNRGRLRYRIAWIIALLAVQGGALYYIGLASPPYADEIHYLKTIKEFSSDLTFDALLDYNEVAGPLPFVLYGAWGKLFGTDISHLRLLSILLAFIFQIRLFDVLEGVTRSARRAFLLGLVVMLNPYMIGLNVVVYTDVPALIGLMLALRGILRRSPWILFFGSAVALLSRQYMMFVVAAAVLYLLIRLAATGDGRDRRMIGAALASIAPLTILMGFWGGAAPPSGVESWLNNEPASWHLAYLVTYVAMLAIYAFPLIAWRWRYFFRESMLWIWSLLFIPLYALAPVQASPITLRLSNYETVGYAHRAFVAVTGSRQHAHWLLFACWVIGVPVVVWIVRDVWRRKRSPDPRLFFDLALISFLAIMPLSFHVWEKYLLPLVPILICRYGVEDREEAALG